MINEKDISELDKILSVPKKIVITPHRSPDGDAMGSALGLAAYLKKKMQQVTVISPTSYPEFLHWLPGNSDVLIYPDNKEKSNKIINDADMIFCVDFNSLKRTEDMQKSLEKSAAVKVMIDHHPEPENFAKFAYSDASASSTAEIVFEFICRLGDRKLVDKDIANCLYTGIMTDTGSFSYAITTRVHDVAAELIRSGATPEMIQSNIYYNNSVDRIRFLGYCLSEKLKVFPELKTAYISVSEEELKKFNHKKGDTEDLVNYATSISGISFAALFVERPDKIKASFRSTGNFSVNRFARKHFNGGGHLNAAGGDYGTSLVEAVTFFELLLPLYKDQLCNE